MESFLFCVEISLIGFTWIVLVDLMADPKQVPIAKIFKFWIWVSLMLYLSEYSTVCLNLPA